MIDKALGLDTPDPAETYSSSPHLYEELNIPSEAGGSIAKPVRTAEKEPREPREPRERPARNRNRRRTRGGQAVSGHPEGAPEQAVTEDAAAIGTDAGDGEARPARRRRRRRPSKATAAGPAAGTN